ncbi:IclR family transcriptional regulator [Lentzea sp. NPDC042327]|uniref:IclR family transcriptional regulator n=1 Tax=Lentzea sp. NPDC042327 TaxID=3154801 RepID=UPI0033D8C679
MGNSDSAAQVQSVDRAISVLELLAQGEAGITEIAGELGVHKSTVSRLVSVLEARGLVEQLGERGKYAIGFGVVRLAGAATGRMDLTKLGQPVCQALADELGETVNIAVHDAGVAINTTQARGSAAVSAVNWIGRRTPLHATSSGKILLAHLPEAERTRLAAQDLDPYTENTVVDPVRLLAELDEVARQGFAVCFEELELGLHAVAVPVRGHRGEVVAAMSASGPSYRLSRHRVREIVPTMSAAAAGLSAQLGYFAG